ncbi:hypothetical protein AJ79_00116 [Helicocarpus griseus UAMH5409]|uniref:Uncharacterized protein n=1 Tax=Helicocarpus griseus UAMH5409 TaxID=1447875 RepID=A0A2B7YDX7_9EURO|nr:hypothetical protein AJ79_00116 [Helicocarpus griseus UAMH5409]
MFSVEVFVGAIIGSVFVSAYLTCLVAYIVFGRRRYKKLADGAAEREKGRHTDQPNRAPASQAQRNSFLDNYVPQPADDQTVKDRILILFDQVALHVENYYSPGPSFSSTRSPSSPSTQSAKLLSLYDSPCLPASAIPLVCDLKTRSSVIKQCLIRTVLSGIIPGLSSPSLPGRASFLPLGYTSYQQRLGTAANSAIDQALFQWRMLTAFVQRELSTTEKQSFVDSRNKHIANTIGIFNAAFGSYANPQYTDSERTGHLTRLIRAATDLEIFLFCQPCGFEFSWQESSAGQTVILPAVVKISDEHGCRLETDQIMVDAVTVDL